MKELKEVRFDETRILLKDALVKSSILPQKQDQMDRTITIQGNTVVEGAVYAHRLEIKGGDVEIQGAVFANLELHITSDVSGKVVFRKAVGTADSVVSRAPKSNLLFASDINAKKVTLYNAFVAGSIYADEIVLENSIVIGGVFATQKLDLSDSIVGTFNSPSVSISSFVGLFLPSAFSIEKIYAAPDTKFYNFSLADFGSLYRRQEQSELSGKIKILFFC
jgi:cytoskeletal protein CcmA (bactofilin family)